MRKVDPMYYQVVTFILLFPYAILAITILGYLSTRPNRKQGSAIVPSRGDHAANLTVPPAHP
jgi:hypothetical protein